MVIKKTPFSLKWDEAKVPKAAAEAATASCGEKDTTKNDMMYRDGS